MVYEVAKGKAFNSPRGGLIHEEKLYDWILANGDDVCGMSVFCYKDEDREAMETSKPSTWFNQAACQWVPIDIDKGHNSDEHTLSTLQSVLFFLEEAGLGEHNMKIYFSGAGYHIMIHEDCFGFPTDHKDLPYVVRSTVEKMAKDLGFWDFIDEKVYMRTSIIRCTFSINPKTNLYKTPLTLYEARTLTPSQIFDLAKDKRLDFPWIDEYSGDGELTHYLVTSVPKLPAYSSSSKEPTNNYSCIYKALNDGPVVGTRNNIALLLASHFHQMGMPSDMAKQTLLDWNNKSLDEKYIIEKVEHAYSKAYHYGCNSRIKKELCSTRCIHYAHKTKFDEATITPQQIIQQAKQKDFVKLKKEGMQLGSQFGLPGYFPVMAGEIVTLIGETKCGKTTLMKNIILGIDFANPKKFIPENNLRKVLYYSAEQPPDMFMFSCLQILEGCTEEVANNNRENLYDKWMSRLEFITPVAHLPTKDSIKEDIRQHKPEVVVIDTLEHAVSGAFNEHQAMKDLMIFFQQSVAETGVTFFIVSQIKREDAKEKKITLFSGKGSGSIENQSRKVFSISSTGDKNIKQVTFLADSYNELPEDPIDLYRLKSGRFKRIIM